MKNKRRFNSTNELLHRCLIKWCPDCGSLIYVKDGHDNYCTECFSENLINTKMTPVSKREGETTIKVNNTSLVIDGKPLEFLPESAELVYDERTPDKDVVLGTFKGKVIVNLEQKNEFEKQNNS